MRDTCSESQHASFLRLSNAENSLDSCFAFGGYSEPCKIWCESLRMRRRKMEEEEDKEEEEEGGGSSCCCYKLDGAFLPPPSNQERIIFRCWRWSSNGRLRNHS